MTQKTFLPTDSFAPCVSRYLEKPGYTRPLEIFARHPNAFSCDYEFGSCKQITSRRQIAMGAWLSEQCRSFFFGTIINAIIMH